MDSTLIHQDTLSRRSPSPMQAGQSLLFQAGLPLFRVGDASPEPAVRKRRGSCLHAAPENGLTSHSQSPGMGTWLLSGDLRAGWRPHLKPVGCPQEGRRGQLCSAAQEGKEEMLGRYKQSCRQNWLGWTMTKVQQLHSRLSNAFSPKEGTLPGERGTCPSVLPALVGSAGFPGSTLFEPP